MFLASKGFAHNFAAKIARGSKFQHLYHWNAFDMSLLIPYFMVMVILAFYGIHRYQLVWLYYRNRKNAAKWRSPRRAFAEGELPFVTIQLPIFNEQFVIDRLIDACCRLDYPRDRFEIQVLDDSTDETMVVAERDRGSAMRTAFAGWRRSRSTTSIARTATAIKAGALDAGLNVGEGRVRRHLRRRFCASAGLDDEGDPSLCRAGDRHGADAVDAPEPQLQLSDAGGGHPAGRALRAGAWRPSRAGVFFNFNGTAGMWRREAIDEAGGWQHDTLTEDTDLSYRAQLMGWKFKYLQDVECPAELPIEMTAFKTQQARWAKGLIQTGKKILPRVLKQRRAVAHQARGLVSPDGEPQLSADDCAERAADAGDDYPQLAGLDADAADRFAAVYGEHDVGLHVLSGEPEGAVSARRWWKTLIYLPFLMALGWGLTITNTKAVLEALFGIKSAFARTPKYRGEEEGREEPGEEVSQAARHHSDGSSLRSASYFALTVWYAMTRPRTTSPCRFCCCSSLGIWYTGLLSLLQGRFERRRARGRAA